MTRNHHTPSPMHGHMRSPPATPRRVARKYTPLTPAQRQRVADNTGLVYECVRRFLRTHPWANDLKADLVQAGLLGLTEAASRRDPDPSLGTQWSTYAWKYIDRWVRESARTTANPASTPQGSGRGNVVVGRGVMPSPDQMDVMDAAEATDAIDAANVRARMITWVTLGRKRGKKPPTYTPTEAVDLFLRARLAGEPVSALGLERWASRQTGRNMYLAAFRAYRAVQAELQAELGAA